MTLPLARRLLPALLLPLGACATLSGGERDVAPDPVSDSRATLLAGATSDEGVFTVHRKGDEIFFEIPPALLGRDFLWVTRLAAVPPGFPGFTPAGVSVSEQVMRFERRGERLLLRLISTSEYADPSEPIAGSVLVNNFPAIVEAFEIKATAPDSLGAGLLIDVTDFFNEDTRAISALPGALRSEYDVRSLDSDRSFVDRVSSFPENIEVRQTQTFNALKPPTNAQAQSFTVQASQSIVLLPEEPMRPRYADPRVGYFTVSRINYGLDEQKAAEQTFIRRWRLEPSDPAAYARGERVEPVEPITYYIDPATPPKWRPWVKQGVEDWNAAFEAAGFRNAIRALDPPSPEEDPEWDPEDVRFSTVRWAASETRNAQGPSTSDPRTGEIIESDIVWYHNHMRSYRNRLMIETGAANPMARTLDIPEELMGEAMRQVIAHEIGHALGLPHNMVSSSAYPTESLRDPAFARLNGVAPSVMDYARQNYIAQPGDGLAPTAWIRQIGVYDHYAIEWGYRRYLNATPEEERETLNRMIRDHAHDRRFKYLPQGGLGSLDPRAQTEDMGDDPVRSSTYGIENLKVAATNLVNWTSRSGEDFSDLDELYGELLGQWNRYVNHVASIIGGVWVDLKSAEEPGVVFQGVPLAEQARALDFLTEQVFTTPIWLQEREILDRIGPVGEVGSLSGRQARILASLMSGNRLVRMADIEILQPENAWPLSRYIPALRDAVFGDLESIVAADAYRRALHRQWVSGAGELIVSNEGESPFDAGSDVASSDIRPLIRAELTELRAELQRAIRRVNHDATRLHFNDLLVRIDAILEG
ncbi:MAG: zinc-dependent metalloprotease [Longimicrobiales bacterium]|nr:zinc-dependent metalloprotease [Longimicrobiales bacterium]